MALVPSNLGDLICLRNSHSTPEVGFGQVVVQIESGRCQDQDKENDTAHYVSLRKLVYRGADVLQTMQTSCMVWWPE